MIAIIEYCVDSALAISKILTELRIEHVVTKSEKEITKADKLILPGSENLHLSVRKLHLFNLFTQLRVIKKPILGISQGMHILCNRSDEGNISCLGIIDGEAKKFDSKNVKVPHMGWNKIKFISESKLFTEIENETYFYFAHSFYMPKNNLTTSVCEHGVEFSASVEKDNFYGVQFHPEKSGEVGLQLLKNFVELC